MLDIDFPRFKLLAMRKFLVNQSEKMLMTNYPFNQIGVNSKKLFDDTFIYLSEAGQHRNSNIEEGESELKKLKNLMGSHRTNSPEDRESAEIAKNFAEPKNKIQLSAKFKTSLPEINSSSLPQVVSKRVMVNSP